MDFVYNRRMRKILLVMLLVGCGGSSSAPDAAVDARPYTACPTDNWFTDLYGQFGANCYGVDVCTIEANLSTFRSTCNIGGVDSRCRRLGSSAQCCEVKQDAFPLFNHMVIRTCD